MKINHRTHRLIAAVLALIMVLAMFPAATAAGVTLPGEMQTIELGNNAAAHRENNFNKGWKFNLIDNSSASNPNFDDSSWTDVDLPHDFSIFQPYTSNGEAESGFLPGGTGWYRKSFTLDRESAGNTFLLNFDGVYMNAYVYVNGTFVGEHHFGYTAFAFDISDLLVCDGVTENVVAVKAVNQLPSSRWYSGSGIYRDVTLLMLDPIHVDLNGVTVTTPNKNSGYTAANVTVVNDGTQSKSVTVTTAIRAKGSEVNTASATKTVTVAAGQSTTVTLNATNNSFTYWSIDDPNLWTMHTELTVDGAVVDSYDTDFGYRWIEWKSTGFYLNGKALKLNGVCMHHDQGGLGSAAYYDAMYRQMSIMKDMGCNAIRTAHNPADEDFIAICNELGLLVIEETFDGLVDPKNNNSNDFSSYFEASASDGLYGYTEGMTNAEYAARSMASRDKNAPCIIAWSFGNEIQEGTYWNNAGRYDEICANYISWVNEEDGTRVVTSGDNNRGGSQELVDVINTITNAGGVAGFNYANSASTLYNLATRFGGSKGVIIASETASHTNSRGQYKNQNNNSDSDGKYHLTSYDTSAVSWGITAHDSIYNTYQYDCVAGEFVWTGFDYLGEPTPWNGTDPGDSGRGAIPNSSYFGIVETTGFPKDSYYLYRAQWNKNATTVHLVTAWDNQNMYTDYSGKTPVWVYTNAAKVELYLNDALIGTTVRTPVTSAAGHTYYTYTATSNNSTVCSAGNNYNADALYSIFNVTYTAGTLSTKAYDENGQEIVLDDTMGRHAVTTPGTASKLMVSQNKTVASADGSSLVYITVDVTDASGNLKTTATNRINFSLTGNGEIVAVDNGDQATTQKYQQSSVLTSPTSANINAYAGKALVIVRTTEDAGSFTVNCTSSGLTGGSATVTTYGGESSANEGMVSYSMIRDYSYKVGTVPTLDSQAIGTLADGSTVSGTITWNSVTDAMVNTVGDHTIFGTLTFDGMEPIAVSAKLHVIPNVIDLRNISTAVMEGRTPALPSTVVGVLADGTLAGEFPVTWESFTASDFNTVGEIITINGTALIFGTETMDVTCAVRVAEAVNTESTNVAPMADSLSEDVPLAYQSDKLPSIKNGILKPGDNTNERWTNWNNRTRSDSATLTMTWATAQTISSVNLYYYFDGCCAYPEALEFSYSLNGQDYQVIGHTAEKIETYSLGAMWTYTFEKPINPVGLKVKLTQQNGTTGNNCVGLTELEVMTYAASFTTNTSADLSGITVDGSSIPGFIADTLSYEAHGSAVAATTAVNAGITVLPVYEGVVRILTVSEDGSASKVYSVTVGSVDACRHASTELRGASAAACETAGYTGDTVCLDCGETITTGTVIAATGHQHTELRNATAATCEGTGNTGDTVCLDCGKTISTGSVIEAKGHAWDAGVISQEPTENQDGVKTFTCTACGTTRTETIKYQAVKSAPSVSLTLSTASAGKIVITGQVNDYENLESYYEITAHGLLYIQNSKIGTRVLTTNTSGRTRVTFSTYNDDGSYSYTMKPSSKTTSYAFRAYITYKDTTTGKSVTVYSNMIRTSYNGIK